MKHPILATQYSKDAQSAHITTHFFSLTAAAAEPIDTSVHPAVLAPSISFLFFLLFFVFAFQPLCLAACMFFAALLSARLGFLCKLEVRADPGEALIHEAKREPCCAGGSAGGISSWAVET